MPEDTRARLEADRADTTARALSLQRTYDGLVEAADLVATDDEHDPDGTTAFERAQIASLLRQSEEHLRELEHALSRLDAGAYDFCERCGQPIGAARLEARPRATMCVSCADQRR